jgi:putative redox protein
MIEQYVEYIGDLHCKLTHGPSKSTLLTDAPVDNHGKGEYFSPTDLVSASVGACILTVMALVADRNDFDIEGTHIKVSKEMASYPLRRIGKLALDISFPQRYEEKHFQMLKNVIKTCPVVSSLNPEIELVTNYLFPK